MGLVNGVSYGWSNITLKMPGLDLEGQSIDYDDELEKELVYGSGSMPRGYGRGNYKGNCKISFLKEDFDDFTAYCKSQGVGIYSLQIPKVIVSYAKDGERIRNDVINRLTPSKVTNKGAQGDKSLTVEVEFLVYGQIVRDGLKAL